MQNIEYYNHIIWGYQTTPWKKPNTIISLILSPCEVMKQGPEIP